MALKEGTDLYPADCDEDSIDGKVDLSQGFTPGHLVSIASEPYFEDPGEYDSGDEETIPQCCELVG